MEMNYRISQRNKVLPIDPVFSNWVNFNKKVSILNCSTNSKSFKAICFFLRSSKVDIFFSFLAFITVFINVSKVKERDWYLVCVVFVLSVVVLTLNSYFKF